jgi:MOSC domain-containing protein YiiM
MPGGVVVAVCASETRGVQKSAVAEVLVVAEHGVRGDAHAGDGHRQVSLLADEAAGRMRAKGVAVGPGSFGENILTSGIDLVALPVGARIRVGPADDDAVLLEVTQIGKVCHDPCAIYAQAGECIMPTQGIFCRVVRGGTVRPGDAIAVAGAEARSEHGTRTSDAGA